MSRRLWFSLAVLVAACAPLLPRNSSPADGAGFPGWPATHEGKPLKSMPAAEQDAYFSRDFPGKFARFAAGDSQVVIRWVNSPTRRLHPAAHCFSGAGYRIEPRPMRRGAGDELMSCFAASKAGEVLQVCELLRGADGRTWPDVSAWYWHAVIAPARSSWWSFVIVSKEPTDRGS